MVEKMRAILVNKEGFHKHIHIAKKVACFRQVRYEGANINPVEKMTDRELFLPIIDYIYERKYIDEWGEEVLIYKEYGN